MATFNVVTEEEKEKIVDQYIEAWTARAPEEELRRIKQMLPLLPCIAKELKESRGLEGLLATNFNLSEVVKRYGKDFLKK